MEQSRLTELDALIDDQLHEFGDNFYYDKDGNAVKKKSGFIKKALIGGAALAGAATLAPLATRGGRARLGKKITTEWNKNSMRPKTGYSAFSAVADDQLREFGKSSQLRESAGKYAEPLDAYRNLYRNGPPKAKMRKPIDKFASPLDAFGKSPKAKIASKLRGIARRARKLI